MRRLLDFDPLTGEAVTFAAAEDGKFHITHSQDVSSFLERSKTLQKDADYTKKGIKEDWWHYASIPNVVQMIWKDKYGVDIGNKNHRKKMFQLLNDPEFSYLKTTHLRHE